MEGPSAFDRNDHVQPQTDVQGIAGLSPLEWSAVAVARFDAFSTLHRHSGLLKAIGSMLGRSEPNRLADGRLEALRRAAVYAWHGAPALPYDEDAAFRSAGFSTAHFDLLRRISAAPTPKAA